MTRVTEMKGNPQVFNLKESSTLRLLPRESKDIKDSEVSEELKVGVEMGLVRITSILEEKNVESKFKKGGTK